MACLQGLLVKIIAFGYQKTNRIEKGKLIMKYLYHTHTSFILSGKTTLVSVSLNFLPLWLTAFSFVLLQLTTSMLVFWWTSLPSPPSHTWEILLCTYFCFFGILIFSGLFFLVISFPFFNHLNLSAGYSEVVSHLSTSFWPTVASWFFISFNLRGTAKEIKEHAGD